MHLTDFKFFGKSNLKSKQFEKADKIYIFDPICRPPVENLKTSFEDIKSMTRIFPEFIQTGQSFFQKINDFGPV